MARIRFNNASSIGTQASLTITADQAAQGNRVVLVNSSPVSLKLDVSGTALPTNFYTELFSGLVGNDGFLKLDVDQGVAWNATAGTITADIQVPHTIAPFLKANEENDQVVVAIGLAPTGNGAIVA